MKQKFIQRYFNDRNVCSKSTNSIRKTTKTFFSFTFVRCLFWVENALFFKRLNRFTKLIDFWNDDNGNLFFVVGHFLMMIQTINQRRKGGASFMSNGGDETVQIKPEIKMILLHNSN